MPNNLLIPAYFDPTTNSEDWAKITQLSASGLDVTAIINPNSGPAASASSAYTSAINSAIDAGAHIVAYVDTANGTRDIDLVKADIDTYLSQYPQLSGFFLDQMSNQSGDVGYYQSLHDYIKGLSASYTVIGNPGTSTLEAYAATADVLVTFEGSATAYQSYKPDSWMANYSADHFANLVYNTATISLADNADQYATAIGIGYSYITNDTFDPLTPSSSNPWDSLSSYYTPQTISGTTTNNNLAGQLGNDSLAGLSGNDTLIGYAGNDLLDGGDGNDSVSGGVGDDNLQGGNGNDTLNGGSGSDTINAGSGNDSISGGTGNDILEGNSGSDTLAGGDGNDQYNVNLMKVGSGSTAILKLEDTIIESSNQGSDDSILLNSTEVLQTASTLILQDNIESLSAVNTGLAKLNLIGNKSANILQGNEANNLINGADGNDTLIGGNGNDTLDGGSGSNQMRGGNGDDAYYIRNDQDTYTENADQGTDTLIFSYTDNSITSASLGNNIENGVINNLINEFSLSGNALANSLTGSSAKNFILGDDGNDTLNGGVGADTMLGGDGNDTYFVDNALDSVLESTNEGIDTIHSSIALDLSKTSNTANIENVTLLGSTNLNATGNALKNTLIGNSGANSLFGGDEDDALLGMTGNDTLSGGSGADTMTGGSGNDLYIVDNSLDSVIETNDTANGGSGIDTIQTGVDFDLSTNGTNIENITLTGLALLATGNALNNTLIGNASNNSLSGGDGSDSLQGNAGSDTLDGGQNTSASGDTLSGGDGDDQYVVSNTKDQVLEINANGGSDLVLSSITFSLGNNIENLTLTGSNTINATGNSLNNIIIGNSGDNILDAGAGVDQLKGGAGDDTYLVDLITSGTGTAATASLQDSLTEESGTDTLKLRGNLSLSTATTIRLSDTTLSSTPSLLINDLSAFEHLNVSQTGNTKLHLIGNDVNNSLIGNASDNSLSGGLGNDTLDGGSGLDTLFGGEGDDTYVIDNIKDNIVETASLNDTTDLGGNDTVRSSITYNLAALTMIENLTLLNTASALAATGNANANTLTGNDFANKLLGNEGDDHLIGNGGNDTLDGGTGADTLEGGNGNDLYIVDNIDDDVIETNPLTTGGVDSIQSTLDIDLSTYAANVENLTFTGTNNLIGTGNALKNVITGNAGNNTLDGGVDTDTLIGGAGNDLYRVDLKTIGTAGTASASVAFQDSLVEINATSGGIDTIELRTTVNLLKATTIVLADGLENLDAHLTSETLLNLTGNAAHNQLIGNDTLNQLNGGLGNDTLIGGLGDDTLDGGSGLDSLEGGDDNDTYIIDLTSQGSGSSITIGTLDTITDSQGIDTVILRGNITLSSTNTKTIDLSTTWSGIENIKADLTGNTRLNLFGTSDANLLIGNAADNVLDGKSGNDTLVGGTGNDVYFVDSLSDIVTELSNAGTDTIQASIAYSLQDTDGANNNGSNVENLVLLGSIDLDGTGNKLNNKITGNTANNLLLGLEGNDTLEGGAGTDTLDGGAGNDTYIVSDINAFVQESDTNTITGGVDTVLSSVDYTISNTAIENLTLTGTAISATGNTINNILTGNVLNNQITGDEGNDVLNGGLGNDTLDGGDGQDTMVGGDGNDTYIIDNIKDLVTETNPNGGTDTVQSSISLSLLLQTNLNIENLSLLGSDNLNATGNDRNNLLRGNIGDNKLNGGNGNDTMIGDDGNDTYVVINSGDNVVETNTDSISGGIDTVNASITYTLTDNVENLSLQGTASINGTGNTLDNLLSGNTGNNSLSGGAGHDTLNGGAGSDTMNGGQGDDTYIVDNANDLIKESSGEGTDSIITSVSFNMNSKAANTENIAAAEGNQVINLTGNVLANQITGNDANNVLTGGLGNDTIDGGEGTDTAVFSGTKNDYDITFINGIYTVTGKDGMDILSNVEKIQFGTSKAIDISSTLASETVPDTALAALDSGLKWETTTITYSFMTQIPTYDRNNPETPHSDFRVMSETEKQMVREVLALYSNITGLTFTPVQDANDSSVMLRYGTENSHDTNLLGYAYNPFPTSDDTTDNTNLGGDVWLNRKSIYSDPNSQFFSESQTFLTLLHETGHALGLKHPFEGSDTLPLSEQNHAYTVMAYDAAPKTELYKDDDSSLNNIDTVTPMTPMLYDIAIMQSLYGSNNSFNSDPTVYAFDQSQPILETLWDSGGNDTIDTSTFTRKSIIDLREGHYSSIGIGKHLGYDAFNHFVELPLIGYSASDLANSIEKNGYDGTNNLAIAYGAIIENAIGGSNDDIIRGNFVNNALDGASGNDNLYGYAGEDTLKGGFGNDTLMAGEGEDTMSGGDGNDELHGGLGNDSLTGGNGQDTFVFDTLVSNDNIDTLVDFDTSVDKIALDHSIFTDLGGSGALTAGSFILGTPSTTSAHQIIYDQTIGVIYYNDGSTTLALATLANNATLSSTDFIIV